MSNYHADETLLKKLRAGDRISWKQLYDDLRAPFRLFFLKYSGMDSEQVTELFHEAMVVLHRNIMNEKLASPLQSTLRTYLFGIGKILCKKFGENSDKWESEIPEIPVLPKVELIEDWQDKAAKTKQLLDKIGSPCNELLKLIYIKGFAMEAVAEEMNFSSAGAVRKRKFDCLKKMRAML